MAAKSKMTEQETAMMKLVTIERSKKRRNDLQEKNMRAARIGLRSISSHHC